MPRISWVIWQLFSCFIGHAGMSSFLPYLLFTFFVNIIHKEGNWISVSSFPLNSGINSLWFLNYRPDIQLKFFLESFTMIQLYCSNHQYLHTFDGRKLHYCLLNLKHLFSEFSENDNRRLCITRACPLIPKTSVRRPNILKGSSEPTVKISQANKIGLHDLHSTLKLRPHSFVHPYKPVKTS